MSKMYPQVFKHNPEKSSEAKCFISGHLFNLPRNLQVVFTSLFFLTYLPTKDATLQSTVTQQVCMFFSFNKSTTVSSEHFDRMQDVTPVAPHLHLLVDHQPCWIKGESVRDSELIQHFTVMSTVLQGGLFISGTPFWWVICTERPPPLCTVQSFPLCGWMCLIQHLRDEHWV